ncbi:MAG: hypothetical protein IKV48_08450 [Eggerthellaceae bacterium]|nr:hypothetical protein [Eggerthellaceae bacterium]
MAEVPIDKRFRGSVRLVTLLLWRIGESTDVEKGFADARAMRMIDENHERFIRDCLEVDARMGRGEDPGIKLTIDVVNELQACALRLNSADPA